MAHFYFLIAAAALLVLAFLWSLWRGLRRRSKLPYVVDDAFLSREQLRFLSGLRSALGGGFEVFGRVRAIDVIGLTGRLSRRERELAFGRLDGRFFDFLICRSETSEILSAVSLVVPSKLRKTLPKDSLEPLCAAAGLPFLRFQEGPDYSVDEVASRLLEAIEKPISWAEPVVTEDDTLQLLRGLTVSIKGETGVSPKASAPERKAPSPKRQASFAKATDRLDELLDAPDDGRREPSIRRLEQVDEGPEFRIQSDLDDESVEQAEYRQRRRA